MPQSALMELQYKRDEAVDVALQMARLLVTRLHGREHLDRVRAARTASNQATKRYIDAEVAVNRELRRLRRDGTS